MPAATRIVNAGVSGFSIRQIRAIAQTLLPKLKPRRVVLGLYASRVKRIDNPYVFHEGKSVRQDMVLHLKTVDGGISYTPYKNNTLKKLDWWFNDHWYFAGWLSKKVFTLLYEQPPDKHLPTRDSLELLLRELDGLNRLIAACSAPGSLDTSLSYAAWRSLCASRASIGV